MGSSQNIHRHSARKGLCFMIWFCFCLLALGFSDPRWTPLMEYISTQTFTGHGCFVLINRCGCTCLLFVSLYSISLVCGMYTMLPKPTPQLIYSICSFRPLSSCSPHWNSTILSIPASLASTVPCLPPSLLLSRLLSCYCWFLAFYPLPPPTLQPSLLLEC